MQNICSSQSEYNLNEAMCGKRYDAMYDPLRAMAMRPDLRKDAILCYNKSSIEGLFAQIQSLTGNEKRRVNTREFFTLEQCAEGGLSIVVLKNAVVPAAGANVTLTIDPASHSSSGAMSLPSAGYMVYLNGTPGKQYKIASTNKTVNGVHTITLTPLNGTVADFSGKDKFTLVVSRMKRVAVCDSDCITGDSFVMSPPTLRKHYVQAYERAYSVKEHEWNNYAYKTHAQEITFTDSYDKAWKTWAAPRYMEHLMDDVRTNRIMETLFGVRDDYNEQGFDGVITTAEKNSFLNQVYDPAQGSTFLQIFMNMVRRIRKTRGCNQYLLAHDFDFGMDWDTGMVELIKNFTGSNDYSLLGPGGKGMRDLEWTQIGNFKYGNYTFKKFLVDLFDDPKFGGNLRKNFAFLMPLCSYKDTAGKSVPPVTYVTMEGSENGPEMETYVVDKRKTMACREVMFIAKDTWGLEIHCASQLGIMYKQTC